MQDSKWLTIPEAATYLRVSAKVFRQELNERNIPYSEFGGQLLFHPSRLDEFLFSIEKPSQGGCPQDFMEDACRLWDDGQDYTVKRGTKGASCQFKGRPRIWIYSNKFQVAPVEKGNELYGPIRKALGHSFGHVTSKATIHIDSQSYSWERFTQFIHEVKRLCEQDLP